MREKLKLRMAPAEAMPLLASSKCASAALLYAFLYTNGGQATDSEISEALGDPSLTSRACDQLILYGIAGRGDALPPVRAPRTDAAELRDARQNDPAFTGLCNHYEQMMGRPIRLSEMQTLSDIVTTLGIDHDAVVLLIQYLKKKGELTPRNLEKQAYRWADDGVRDYARAEAGLRKMSRLSTRQRQIARIMGIGERAFSATESKYLTAWSEAGYTDDILREAYDRTVMRTGRMQYGYMDKILSSWKEKGVSASEQIASLDGRREENIEQIVTREMESRRKNREKLLSSRLRELRQDGEFLENEKLIRITAARAARDPSLKDEKKALEKKQSEILKRLGKPADWIDIKPDCPLCGDLGYIGSKKCSCFKKACEQKRKELGIK